MTTKQKRKPKEKIKPANPEQEAAIKAGRDFVNEGKSNEWMVIGGKAGTGKTTIAIGVLQPFVKKKRILVCAIAHKAKLVLLNKLAKVYGAKNFTAKTVAGALAMNMDMETGEFTVESERRQPIKTADIIMCDEASMINEDAHRLIMEQKRKGAYVIYLGDIRQLPPIRPDYSPFAGKPSPVFHSKNFVVLKERIRQGEGSPILPFADYFGDNTRLLHPVEKPAPPEVRKNIITDKWALIFAKNILDVIDNVMPLFRQAVNTGNVDVIKIVSYRNDNRKYLNEYVRQKLFGYSKAQQPFVVGDLAMFYDNYEVKKLNEPLSNALEVQVTSVKEEQDMDMKVWKVGFTFEKEFIEVPVLDTAEVAKHTKMVRELFDYARNLPSGTEERKQAFAEAWDLKNRFAPLEHGYAITSHKVQGSEYTTIIVDEGDIISVTKIGFRDKSHSLYTAISRAKNVCIMVDGQETDELMMQQAVELSMRTLT